MRNYEVTLIVDPVLSNDEIRGTAREYEQFLKDKEASIVYFNDMGLLQLAYPIQNRTSGVYFCIEFETETGEMIDEMELNMRRDVRILRFLTVKLDKYGVKYNDDKRNGRIGKKREKVEEEVKENVKQNKARRKVLQENRSERAKEVQVKVKKEE